MRIEATLESVRTVIRPVAAAVRIPMFLKNFLIWEFLCSFTMGGRGGPEGGASRGKDRARGGDGRGTSQWPKVMGTHINAYPGSERNGYTLVVVMNP